MNRHGDFMRDSDYHGDHASDALSTVVSLIIAGLAFHFFGALAFIGYTLGVLAVCGWHFYRGLQAVRDGR